MADPNMQGALVAASIYQKLLEQYPDFAPLFEAVPELRPLFIESITGGWTTTKFAEELHKTDWWKKTPEKARLWLATSVSDPAEAGQQRQQTIQQFYDIAAQMGVSVPLQNMYLLAEASLRQGWDDNQIRRALLDQTSYKDPLAGTLDSTATQVKQVASDWGVPFGDQAAFNEAKKIAGGRGSIEGFTEQMRQAAKSLFPAWAQQIDEGATVSSIAEPYKQMVAQTLEIDPSQIDLKDNKWRRLLQRRDDKTGRFSPLTVADAEGEVMSNPLYGYDHTRNAANAAFNLREQLAQTFGVSA